MTRPWQTLARQSSPDGLLELRQRDADDFLITLAGRVLMNSRSQRSERALAELGCAHLQGRAGTRVLIGGLGMGVTLRAALEQVGAGSELQVAELHPVIGEWCAGPLAELNGQALADARVRLRHADVAHCIERAAGGDEPRFDAILLDLFEGPHARSHPRDDPFYGSRALARCRAALRRGGVLAVWAESPVRSFERRLRRQDFTVVCRRPGHGGLRHAVYVATASGAAPPGGAP